MCIYLAPEEQLVEKWLTKEVRLEIPTIDTHDHTD